LGILGFDAGRHDGIFGPRTERAVMDFQRNVGLPLDGMVGATTLEALRRLRPIGSGPGRSSVREAEQLRRLSTTITGARIAVDPGHGSADPGVTGVGGITEAEAARRVAHRLAERLQARGGAPFLTHEAGTDPTDSDRARRANELGAEILVAIHFSAETEPDRTGALTAYYGRDDWHSQGGRRLAEMIQEELAARTGLPDRGAQPRALAILRETRMPAVQVEPGSLADPDLVGRLGEPEFVDRLVEAMADAIERYFAGPGEEPPEPA
jgi:N-acetylmuramoyl-L-alanine amidase